MFKNYFKIAARVLWKSKVFSGVNIIGLALGIACCLVIALYVYNELRHDTFHKNINNIYRIVSKQNQAGTIYDIAVTPGPLADAMPKDFPEVKNVVRMGNWSGLLKHNATVAEAKNIQLTENSFFSIFDFKMLVGDAKSALQSPDDIVLTEKAAEKFFGAAWRQQPLLIGKLFTLNGEHNFKLAGVVANPPHNSSIQFEALLPIQFVFNTDKWSYKWGSNNYHTYLLLQPQTDVASFNSKLTQQIHLYNPKNEDEFLLQPMREQYLYSKFDFFTDWGNRSDIKYVRIFGGVGLLLLLIACVNFINLATARSAKRAVEVGVRKVTGASRRQLSFQFLSESLLTVAIAAAIAVLMVKLAQPFMAQLIGNGYTLPVPAGLLIGFVAVFIIIIGVVAGVYPAFVLSAWQPAESLKGQAKAKGGSWFRKGLVVFQFAICVSFMICTLFMYRQLTYMQEQHLGFNTEQVIRVRLGDKLKGNVKAFKNDLMNESVIAAAAPSTMSLANVDNSGNLEWDGMTEGQQLLITQANIDPDFLSTLDMKITAGSNFLPQADTAGVNYYMLNETAVKMMGISADSAVGMQATFWGAKGTIIGVVNDFHYKPLSAGIQPFIFRYQPWSSYFNLFVKTVPGKTAEAINVIEKHYKKYEAETPFEFVFLNDAINDLYKKDTQTASVLLLFTCLTIFVGCLGLFGLTVFAAEQRIKEIGIRKVLGASVASVTQLLSKDFLKLILIGIVVALPVAAYVTHAWLENYAYRIGMDWWVFAVAGGLIVLMALLTISFQSIKAAMANPVKSLRNE